MQYSLVASRRYQSACSRSTYHGHGAAASRGRVDFPRPTLTEVEKLGIATLSELQQLYHGHGVTTIYVKHLAVHQDNEKNQILLGRGLYGLTNLFPAHVSEGSASKSIMKPGSEPGRPKLTAQLKLSWIGRNNILYPAPHAALIHYHQYPETRLSGFLKDCDNPPDALRRAHQLGYGRRVLVLGVQSGTTVIGCVLTELGDPLVADFPDLPLLLGSRTLRVVTTVAGPDVSPRELLLSELRTIAGAGWHTSQRLKPRMAAPMPFSGSQGAGYTLEAVMGITTNADNAPDKYGFEIKTHGSGTLSLMTPAPDLGFQGTHKFREFMAAFGTPGKKSDGSTHFSGVFRCGVVNSKNGLTLTVAGYDTQTRKFADDHSQISVMLASAETGTEVAGWSLGRLMNTWNRKHAFAAYVAYESRPSKIGETDGLEYRYGPKVHIGEGTDVWMLLRAIANGAVFYDPGDSISSSGKPKARPQWRMYTGELARNLEALYNTCMEVNIYPPQQRQLFY